MSPSLPAVRRVWFWSAPALAIFLSFLWYRKKRGSLKTDSGGVVEETENDQIGISNQESKDPSDNSLVISEDLNPESGDSNQLESIKLIEHIEENPSLESVTDAHWLSIIEPSIEKVLFAEELREKLVEEIVTEPEVVEAVDAIDAKEKEKQRRRRRKRERKRSKKMAKKSKDERREEDNTACILEKKLAELDLSANKCNGDPMKEKPLNEDVAERDSANNSPSEVMLACPSVSGYSDTHSEGSSDSGKGCSEMLTPSRTPASGNSVSGDNPSISVYEFEIPQYLVGRLIGRHGCNEIEIKKATNASIYIKTHPTSERMKICAIEGAQVEIYGALEMIRRKFPKKHFPNLSLEQVVIMPKPLMFPIFPEHYQLPLVEGINNDVIVSSLVSANHFFLQQPTHPTFLSLARLDTCMALCYSEPDHPSIPEGVGSGILCAAPAFNGWYRAQIMEWQENNEYCVVKFLDYGGFMSVPVTSLRQIRADFINLPFQACECFLADVKPANGRSTWSESAKELIESLTYGIILQAQVYGYTDTGTPLIYLYTTANNESMSINEELVHRGWAEWDYEPVTVGVQENDEGALHGSEIEEDGFVAEPV